MDDLGDDLFGRVRPVVGDVLEARRVAVLGSPAAVVLVDYLAACGVRQWVGLAGDGWLAAQVATLRARFGDIDMGYDAVESVAEIGAGVGIDLAIVVDDGALAATLPNTLPRVLITTPTADETCRAAWAMAGEDFSAAIARAAVNHAHPPAHAWAWLTAAPLMALLARAILAQGTAFAMPTWEVAWARGVRAFTVGAPGDPTRSQWDMPMARSVDSLNPIHTPYQTPLRRQGTLLVAGLGSLGSVAAAQLAPWVARLVLVDPDHVERANLVRQHYSHDQVGMAKAVALATTLQAAHPGLVCEAVVAALDDDEQVAALLQRYGVTGALVTTGTHADFAIVRALHAASLPHVVGRCYARARYWEGIVVDCPTRENPAGGASYEQMRRHVNAGPTPAPTPEEVAAYGAVGELVSEPATAMETGWAAMWLARLTSQMIVPATLREGWLVARLAAGATCFAGGVVVEPSDASGDANGGGFAYGVAVPGEVYAWTVAEIA